MVTQSMLMKRASKLRGPCCESCKGTTNLQAHHENGDRTNNSPENLRTLCAACHTRWHWENGKQAWRRHSPTCLACGKPARRLGLCETHRSRHMRHGHPCLVKRKAGHSWQLTLDRGGLSGPAWTALLAAFPSEWTACDVSETPSSRSAPK